jgi:hypothetical protein
VSKGNRNRDHRRNGSPRLPPTAGAVDLESLRKRPDHDEKVAAATVQVLARQGLVCPCGERVRDQGVEYLAVVVSDAPTPAGPVANVGLGSSTFHARDCPLLVEMLVAEPPDGTQPLALRAAPAVLWLDEQEVPAP